MSLVVRHSQSAEALVKLYEAKLSEEDAVNSDLKSIDTVVSTLKVSSLCSSLTFKMAIYPIQSFGFLCMVGKMIAGD